MIGYFYAFGAAFFTAASDAMAKQALQEHSPVVVAWAKLAYASIFLLPLLFFIPIPSLDGVFWFTIAMLLPMEIIAIILYMKALQMSPLSLTVPFLSLTPAFTIITSFLILGELPDLPGLVGICFIVAGAFALNIHLLKQGILQPLRSILSEKGSLYMIAVAFIYSITSVLGKAAIQHSSPAFMGVCYIPMILLALFPFAVRKGMHRAELKSGMYLFFLIGACQALTALCHFKSISMILVSYMISVKRLSLLFGVAFGGFFFHEEYIKQRLAGSLLMLAGVVLIVV
jgi:drug/metabolite transporter (DMT)-like permease